MGSRATGCYKFTSYEQLVELLLRNSREMGNKNSADRSYILIGKMGDGKSTLGNLLSKVGQVKSQFKVPEHQYAMGTTQKVEFVDMLIPPGILNKDEAIRIQVFDLPGLNDPNFTLAMHSRNIIQCIRRATPTLFVTFVIVINISAESMDPDLEPTIVALSRLLDFASYSFFSQAVVVFTHADKLVSVGKRAALDLLLQEKCHSEKWGDLDRILTRVDRRYMYVNAKKQKTEKSQVEIMKELYELSKPTLRIMFHGNTNFKASEMKRKLGIRGEANFIDQQKYRIECLFSSDLQLHLRGQIEITEEIQNAIKDLKLIGRGISMMIILIDLTSGFTNMFSEMITKLPRQYTDGDNKFWDYAFIMFKLHDQHNVERQIRDNLANNAINKVYRLAGGRHTWVAKTSLNKGDDLEYEQESCLKRIIDCCLLVKKVSQGKNYVSDVVISEMESMIQEMHPESRSSSQRALSTGLGVAGFFGTPMIAALGSAGVLGGVGAVAGPVGAIVGGATGGLIGLSGGITVNFAYYILRKVKPELINKFKRKFSNPDQKISDKQFHDFLEGKEHPEIKYGYEVIDNVPQITDNILPAKYHDFLLDTDDNRDTPLVADDAPLVADDAPLLPDNKPPGA